MATAEIKAAFDYLNYGWGIPESDEYYLVCIDGGEMSIILICDNIEILDIFNHHSIEKHGGLSRSRSNHAPNLFSKII